MKLLFSVFSVGFALLIFGNILGQPHMNLIISMRGDEPNVAFGHAVSSAGDVNGDGYGDVVVGTPGGAKVCVYLGSEDMDTIPDVKLHWDRSPSIDGDCFGYAVSFGDLNGDGFSDVVVGAPNTEVDEIPGTGAVGVYFGGNPMDSLPDLILTEVDYNNWYRQYGRAISADGDLNGDGYDDLVVGAPTGDFNRRGMVYVYFGAENMDTTADLFFVGGHIIVDDYGYPEELGYRVAIVGDVNGDGYDDFVLNGRCLFFERHLYFGGNPVDTSNHILFKGSYICGLGDLNGDNFYDIAVRDSSEMRVYFGSPEFDTVYDLLLPPVGGNRIRRIGDVNSDGYDDAGEVFPKYPELNEILIYFGGSPMDTIPDAKIVEEKVNDDLGPCSRAGDVNGDGWGDVIVSAPSYRDSTGTRFGKVYIYTYRGTGVEYFPEASVISSDFGILKNIPNPFERITFIYYCVPRNLRQPNLVDLQIYDISGRLVRTLLNGVDGHGIHCVRWDGRNSQGKEVRSGIYFCRMSYGGDRILSSTEKLILLR